MEGDGRKSIRQPQNKKIRKIIVSGSLRSIKEWELSQCWRENSTTIFWKQWQRAICPVGFTLGWCPEWTINKIFLLWHWQLYLAAVNNVPLTTVCTNLTHILSLNEVKTQSIKECNCREINQQRKPISTLSWNVHVWVKVQINLDNFMRRVMFTIKYPDDIWVSEWMW